MTNDFIQYDLSTNFDDELLDYIIKRDAHHQIKSLFGKLKADIAGGGRASSILPDLSMKQLEDHVRKCTEAGIEFNYLINPITLNDSEISAEKSKQLIDFIDSLYEIGIRSFTINSPYLCMRMKKRYSDIRITVGLYAVVMTIQQIQYWVNMGADEITLDHIFNRNFPLLRHVLEVFKDTNVKIRLIANNFCLHECAYKINHACNIASQSVNYKKEDMYMDYSLLNCTYHKVKNKSAMLSSDWIRPEDIKVYKKMADDIGTDNLTIKLVERTRSTAYLKRVVDAYQSERYDGNLLDILNWPMSDTERAVGVGKKVEREKNKDIPFEKKVMPYKIEKLQQYGRSMQFPKIYIDNKKLDGFIDHFVNNFDCRQLICKNNILPVGSECSSQCSYCDIWADKAITFNEGEVNQWLAIASDVINSIEERTVYSDTSVLSEIK